MLYVYAHLPATPLHATVFALADGPVQLLSMSRARLVNELNRTVLRYMGNNPFPKLVPTVQPAAVPNAARPGAAAAQAPAVTCTLSYVYATLVYVT